MNFSLDKLNPVYTSKTPAVGNVYAAQGGAKDGTRFWIVLAIRGDSCKLLGIDNTGQITGGQSYYTSVMAQKALIGWCPGIMDLDLDIEGLPS